MQNVLVDTGFWYAAFENRDPYHGDAQEKLELLDHLRILLPWPILYETLRTRFVRNALALARFEKEIKSPRIVFLDDSTYRMSALDIAIESSFRHKRSLSMVDSMIRLALEDKSLRIKYLATFNIKDFADVCYRNAVELI